MVVRRGDSATRGVAQQAYGPAWFNEEPFEVPETALPGA